MTPIRIGTRESELALWQAKTVQSMLDENGVSTEIVPIKSEGDIDLQTPLYEMGVQGIFTKSLDIALLNNKIDIAVHSLKDVPTRLAKGIVQAAVLKRGNFRDLLVYKGSLIEFEREHAYTIATGSIRRSAQWLHRFPQDKIENLRGNVNTRIKKLEENNWKAAIFAAAGLERINLRPENSIELEWMLPSPAQGAITVVCRKEDAITYQSCRRLNDMDTESCTGIERDFLHHLMGGCTMPISALAVRDKNEFHFLGSIFSIDGKMKAEINRSIPIDLAHHSGKELAEELLQKGGKEIADSIRNAGTH